ncbi:MAG: SUMF1/EgtB/PvdO family nonheme iron enzyme [Bacteroidaceae bacterium]|nr:SUMF1/EgtB/PvdO family nonheme iron enzyme [Bacteroidaceae bacterium]
MMKKFLSFAAFALLAVFTTVGLSACGGDDDDDKDGGSKFENKTVTVGDVSFTMVAVQGGTFQMGAAADDEDADDDEKPQHAVTLADYYIGATEVTQALWKAVMDNNPSYFIGDDLPVEKVSWTDCQEFIAKLNEATGMTFRLPTEAEWEYAARGGNKSGGFTYAGSNTLAEVAWYKENSENQTHAVAGKKPNELGLYDMSGNVWEWCSDWYGEDYYADSPSSSPQGPETGSYRVDRGGSWGSYPQLCRASNRDGRAPVNRCSYLGLRLVLQFP